ncbi:2-dehydropantoate 2-reductase [Acidisphaera sp. S103]|uniref:2-dehydropantoate 2-reductase n=1 Tax=Acidisphaera sp. S103 TaxID=1747223 RepID=UPI00131E701D|nr:2-dehydropantoate 2-reductase [Acidisphaera sp. S103]
MPTIAVIGPGAIGGTVAAWLAQNPANTVTVCVRTPFDCLVIDTPHGLITATPKVLISPEQANPVDWVLIATKAYDVAATALWLPRLSRPGTRIAVLQNGVEHIERFCSVVPVSALVPVVIDLPAERAAPGRVRQRRDGLLTVPDDANGQAFMGLFDSAGLTVTTTPDFRSHAWRKLALNCAGAVSALVLKPAGIAAREPIADIMRSLVRECIAVGRAEGAILDDDWVETVVQRYRDGPADAINSLHADRLAGRRIEIDARNGAVARLGRRHSIATPVNTMIVALLQAASTDD